jgi:hypothetical protein
MSDEPRKPEWATDAVWEDSVVSSIDAMMAGSRQEAAEIIAYVSMRAYAAGIERAASLCDKRGDWGKEVWDEYVASGSKGPATSYHEWFYTMGAFIRRFGKHSETEPDIAAALTKNRSEMYWDGESK